jgi:hypothetical protein
MTKNECNCEDGCEGHNHGMPSAQEIAIDAHYKLEGLIRVLVKKKLITQEDFINEMNQIAKEIQTQEEAFRKQMEEETDDDEKGSEEKED